MFANSKWPDFRRASSLHPPTDLQTQAMETKKEMSSFSLSKERNVHQKGGYQSKESSSDAQDSAASISEEFQGFASEEEDDEAVPSADIDFGELEMFDSNASQQLPSLANLPTLTTAEYTPEPFASEDDTLLLASRKRKQEKKTKKSKSGSVAAGSNLSAHSDELEDHPDRHKKLKRKSRAVAENQASPVTPEDIIRLEVTNEDAHHSNGLTVPSSEQTGVFNSNTERNISPEDKRKRKSSHSAESKRHKKKKTHKDFVQDAGSKATIPQTASADLVSSRILDHLPDGNSHEDTVVEGDEQETPVVARIPRYSQSNEASARTSKPIAPFDANTAVAQEPDTRAARPAGERASHEKDVETLARKAWNKHTMSQQASSNAEDGASAAVLASEKAFESTKKRRTSSKDASQSNTDQVAAGQGDDGVHRTSSARSPQASKATASAGRKERSTEKKDKASDRSKTKKSEPDEHLGGSDQNAKPECKVDRQSRSALKREDTSEGAHKQSRRQSRLSQFVQGRFSEEELARITRTIECYRSNNDLSQEEVNRMVHAPGGTSAGDEHAELWTMIFEACPDRHRQALINFTRRRFHNFVARGTWTKEQDEELNALIQVHGQKWTKIGAIINRHPEDIRDRWRNYLVCGPHQRKETWDEAEEARLTQVVVEAMESIDHLRSSEPNDMLEKGSYEELIDWQHISSRMGRSRSRLQCMTKWKAMNLSLHAKDKLLSGGPQATITFRLEKARRQMSAMPVEERYRVVLAIHESQVGQDSKIPWARLIDKKFRSRWHRQTLVLLWRRLRKTVPRHETKTTRVCAAYLVKRYKQTGELPDLDDGDFDDREESSFLESSKEASLWQGSVSRSNGTPKSAEFITSSDEQDQEEDYDDDEVKEGGGEVAEDMDAQIDPALSQLPAEGDSVAPFSTAEGTDTRALGSQAEAQGMEEGWKRQGRKKKTAKRSMPTAKKRRGATLPRRMDGLRSGTDDGDMEDVPATLPSRQMGVTA